MRARPAFWHVLSRVWGAVAFFHPWVQEDGQRWEEALVSVLPDAEAVAGEPPVSAGQLRVLDALLSALGDGATRLVHAGEEDATRRSDGGPAVTRETLEGNIAWVRVHNWFDFRISPGYFAEWEGAIRTVNEIVETAGADGAAGLILDFRGTRGDRIEGSELRFVHDRMRSELVARLLAEPVRLPGLARIQRVGYADSTESGATLGGYHVEWVAQIGGAAINPAETAYAGPLAMLTGPDTSAFLEPLLVLLQRTGRAVCVGDQSMPYRHDEQVLQLTDDLSLQLRRYTLMYHDRPARYSPVIATDDPLGAALSMLRGGSHCAGVAEPPSPQLQQPHEGAVSDPPSRAWRMLAAIKLWTAMREFYPVRDHLARWGDALPEAVEDAAAADTSDAYFQALQRLSSSCRGGHNFVLFRRDGALRHASRPHGYAPRVRLVRVNGDITIAAPVEGDTWFRAGDVIEAVDSEPIGAREERLRPLFLQYPPGARDHYLLQALLDSPEGAPVRLRVRRGDAPNESVVPADAPVSYVTEPVAVAALPSWGLMPGGLARVGYLDASRITPETLEAALRELEVAEALIFDLRVYPKLHVPAMSIPGLIRHTIPKPPVLRPVLTGPEQGVFGWIENRFSPMDEIPAAASPDERPVAALIGGGTVSLGEDWARTLKLGCGALLVGSVTAGGVGSNAWVNLPGGGRASFSGSLAPMPGLARPVEGNGIEPDLAVLPVAGAGEDIVVTTAARALLERLPR